jgi:phosphoribosylglycinamide formyltransferase-1
MEDSSTSLHKEFVCEPIEPVKTSFDTASMSAGEPGLPARFIWRGQEHQVAAVLDKWKTTGSCRHGSGEQYVRRHWFRVVTTDGTQLEIYFDRRSRSRQKNQRWWVAAVFETASDR